MRTPDDVMRDLSRVVGTRAGSAKAVRDAVFNYGVAKDALAVAEAKALLAQECGNAQEKKAAAVLSTVEERHAVTVADAQLKFTQQKLHELDQHQSALQTETRFMREMGA